MEDPQSGTSVAHSRYSNLLLWGSLAVYLLCYFGNLLYADWRVPLWMDEILLTWTSRLPTVSQIYWALAHGSDYSPPTQHVFLHYFCKAVGGSNLALRLPSTAAVFLAATCAFILYRRHLGKEAAIFGACLMLESLRFWGVQVRPYAIVAACFAAALLLWDGANRRPEWWRCASIGLLLALATSLHFYAVLLVPCLAAIELIYTLRTRRFRLSLWIAFLAAGASIFIWLPLIHAISRLNAGDTGGSDYYARPSLHSLMDVLHHLILPSDGVVFLLLASIIALAVGKLLGHSDQARDEDSKERQGDFWNLVLGTALLPLIVFAFSIAVTKTFVERYSVGAYVATSALFAGTFSPSVFFRRSVPMIVLFGAVLTLGHRTNVAPSKLSQEVLDRVPGPYPIVIADGVQFFPLEETASPEMKSRLYYLTPPPGQAVGDPTNQHAIERWKTIDRTLNVEDVDAFLQSHPKFYVLDRHSSDDTPAQYLIRQHVVELTDQVGDETIYTARAAFPSSTQ